MLKSIFRLAVNSRFSTHIFKMSSELVIQTRVDHTTETATVTACKHADLEPESKDSGSKEVADDVRLAAEKYYSSRHQRKNEMKAQKKRELKERRAKAKETKEVGFNLNESLKQTDYYFENGLRKVYPYFFYWNTTAKGNPTVFCCCANNWPAVYLVF